MRALALLVILALARPVFADQIGQLTQQLASSSEKTRITAVVSLAKLGDKRALKPLVTALHDPSDKVRALAAVALGHLGHKAALPSLRSAATDDTDATVRAKAREATLAVAKANHLPDELPPGTRGDEPPREARHSAGFGRSPHAIEDRPDLFVTIKSANDDSPGKLDKQTRTVNAQTVRQSLLDALSGAPQVTMAAQDAQRWGLDPRVLDVSVVKLEVEITTANVECTAELRLAISDESGKMLSFVSGGATVSVPRAKFEPGYLPTLRKDALEGAMRGLFDKLLAHLRDTSQS